jgi:hypothetical protein
MRRMDALQHLSEIIHTFPTPPKAAVVQGQPHAQAACSPGFRVALALAIAALVTTVSWRWMGGFSNTLADLRTLGVATLAAGFAYCLAGRFLLLFVVGMAPLLVLLALLAHWLP